MSHIKGITKKKGVSEQDDDSEVGSERRAKKTEKLHVLYSSPNE